MERNNGQTIFLSVIGIATLLVAIIGATFAYFTTTINGTDSSATITTAKIGSVGYTTSSTGAENVLPGWEGTGSTSVYLTSTSTEAIAYTCTLKLKSGSYARNIYVQTTSGSDAQASSETALFTVDNTDPSNPVYAPKADGVVIASGTLAAQTVTAPATGTAHDVAFKVIFKELGVEQNYDQGQTVETEVSCSIDTSHQYTYTAPAGNGD